MKYTPDIFVGLDQAERTGWCLIASGRVLAHGVTRDEGEVVGVVAAVISASGGNLARVLVAFEDHSDIPLTNKSSHGRWGGPQRNTASLLGMGDARGGWRQEFARFGHPSRLRLLVTSEEWRMRVLGLSNRHGTAKLKLAAKQWASAKLNELINDDNEAEAVAIASWAALDGIARLEQGRTAARIQARDKRQEKRQLELLTPREASR